MLLKHPILSRDAEALEKVQKLTLKFVKGLRRVAYEAALQQLRLFSLEHQRIRGDLISMFKITHGLLKFPMESAFTHPPHKGLRDHTYKFHQQSFCTRRRQYAFAIPAVPFRNKLLAKIVNASSVKPFKISWTSSDSPCSPKYPFNTPPPTTQSLSTLTHVKNSHPNDHSHIPPPPHLVVYSSPNCFEASKTDFI